MRCPFCGGSEDKVIDSRVSKDAREIRRRRECEACERRFTTYERIEDAMPLVVKRDGRREPFDRNKIERGLQHAVAKRPVAHEEVLHICEDIEREVSELGVAEIASHAIGERVLPRLHRLDQVAYVRFASIYRDFRTVKEFAREVEAMGVAEAPAAEADAGAASAAGAGRVAGAASAAGAGRVAGAASAAGAGRVAGAASAAEES
jgi:transcriptional repressor NrdR